MATIFNIIACMLPLVGAAEIEVAGRLMGRVLPEGIECPGCGAHYNLIVPAGTPPGRVTRAREQLRRYVRRTCGDHPPIIQEEQSL